MGADSDAVIRLPVVVHVITPGRPAFQLVKGEPGLSVFDPNAIEPTLTTQEILESFREGSEIVTVAATAMEDLGLHLAMVRQGICAATPRRAGGRVRAKEARNCAQPKSLA
jgi:hypothetical protein